MIIDKKYLIKTLLIVFQLLIYNIIKVLQVVLILSNPAFKTLISKRFGTHHHDFTAPQGASQIT